MHTQTPVCWQWEGRLVGSCLGASVYGGPGYLSGARGPVPVCDAPSSFPASLCVSQEAGRPPPLRCRAVEDTKLQTLSLHGWPSCIKGPKVPGRSSDLRLRVKSGPRRSRQGKWEHSCCGEGPFSGPLVLGSPVCCPHKRAAAFRPTELPVFLRGRIVGRNKVIIK